MDEQLKQLIKSTKSLVSDGSSWLPGSYSTLSSIVDNQFYFILGLSILFSLAIFIVTIIFSIRYRRRPNNLVSKRQIVHNNRLEIIWTVIPFFIVMGIFYWGFKDYLRLTTAPVDAEEIIVVGQKWFWVFEYPDTGLKSMHNLVVPVGKSIKLVMYSQDVLHSFFIPNFRVKRDVQPNRYSNIWFEAEETGVYQIFCTEYCGDKHSQMGGKLIVMSQNDYDDWKASAGMDEDMPLDQLGAKLYKSKGCNACHSIDGSNLIGPTWKEAYGAKRELTTGEIVDIDDNYIRESIVYPANKIAAGYPNVMPSYAGLLTDNEINAIIEYMKTLK